MSKKIKTNQPDNVKMAVLEMKYPKPEDVSPSCSVQGCNNGWLYHQAPHKPLGVIMCTSPCLECNADGKKPDPMHSTGGTWKYLDADPTGVGK